MAEIVTNYLEQTNEINELKRESFVHKLKRTYYSEVNDG